MPSIPQSYKAAVISEKGAKFEIKDIDYKKPEDGHITIKVLASGVCHSDSIVVDQLMPTGLPRIPGHEIVGRVVEVPESEKRWKVGQIVGSGWHGGHCFSCPQCDRGDFITCEKKNINGVITDGGHSEYATIRREAVLAIPEGIEPAKAAPLLCAGVTVYNSIRHMDLMAGDVVAIQGLGGLGHLGVQIAAQMGMKVVALSGSDSKRKLATELGAHVYVDGSKEDFVDVLQKLGGAKVIACTAPNGELMSKAVNGLAVNGTLLILGVGDKVEVPIMPMIGNRLQIRGWPAGTAADSEDTIRFAMTTGVETRIETYPLDKIQDAYDSMMNNKVRFRSVIVFDE
ncbi:GroES-like protein [Rhodotorula sp. JG-1b]|nr:GroES-like protein [Rhodotorula sp. JG-1b]